jgi:hypothetical protein
MLKRKQVGIKDILKNYGKKEKEPAVIKGYTK